MNDTTQILNALGIKPADDNWIGLQVDLLTAARAEAMAGNEARAAHLMLVAKCIVNDPALMGTMIDRLYDGLRAKANA